MVIASLKSWDGTRILGVFENEDLAIKTCETIGINTNCEEFNLDFVQMNKVSLCQTILVDKNSTNKGFRRTHVYEDVESVKNNVT